MTTTAIYLDYFHGNFDNVLRDVPSGTITEQERCRIERSIQSFQLGEASEGLTLQRLARLHGERTGDPYYLEAIRCLIREENRHSAYLKRFMDEQGIPTARRRATDGVFRFLRRLMGIEMSIRTLVVAETIALTYYSCLAQATAHAGLKAICSRMLEEERQHVRFQMHTANLINRSIGGVRMGLADAAHAGLLTITAVAVWIEHRPVLRVSHDFFSFWTSVRSDFYAAMEEGRASASNVLLAQQGGRPCATA